MERNKWIKRIVSVLAVCAFIFLVRAQAEATIIPAYFGWNYVNESGAAPPPVLELTSFTYTGGAGAGLIMNLPAFPGFPGGMPDGIPFAANPTFTTGGDGETTRTIGTALPIDWIPGAVSGLGYPSINITSITTSILGVPFKTYTGFPPYTVGLIPSGPNSELLSLLPAAQGDIYNILAGVPGNPTLSGTDPVSGTIITATFAASAVPEPTSLLLIGTGLVGLIGRKRKWKK